MRSALGLISASFAASWVLRVATGIARADLTGPTTQKWVIATMGLFVVVGMVGFFAAALSADGVLKLPNSFEWPAGYVRGVAQTTDGNYVVPLVIAGRIQIYDSSWHFLRGWHVAAEGGDFNVESLPDGTIEVLTARGRHRYSFTEDGDLISAEVLSETFYGLRKRGISVLVPTSPLLWVFSSPFLSMGLAMIGLVGMSIIKKLALPH